MLNYGTQPDMLGSLTAAQRSIWAAQQLVPEVPFNIAGLWPRSSCRRRQAHGRVRISGSAVRHTMRAAIPRERRTGLHGRRSLPQTLRCILRAEVTRYRC
jgi:hypothetical protein